MPKKAVLLSTLFPKISSLVQRKNLSRLSLLCIFPLILSHLPVHDLKHSKYTLKGEAGFLLHTKNIALPGGILPIFGMDKEGTLLSSFLNNGEFLQRSRLIRKTFLSLTIGVVILLSFPKAPISGGGLGIVPLIVLKLHLLD